MIKSTHVIVKHCKAPSILLSVVGLMGYVIEGLLDNERTRGRTSFQFSIFYLFNIDSMYLD